MFHLFDLIFSVVPILFFAVFIIVAATIIRTVLRETRKAARTFDPFSQNQPPRQEPDRTAEYVTRIRQDFPDFSWEETRMRTQNAVRSALIARTSGDLSLLPPDASPELRRQVELQIADDQNGGTALGYDDITVKNTVITGYDNPPSGAVIGTKTAVRCTVLKKENGRVFRSESKDLAFTCCILFQEGEAFEALICPGCGAALDREQKFCSYCGRGIAAQDRRIWKFGTVNRAE